LPGAGKSMLARGLPSILPPLEPAEMLEVSMIRSLSGDLAGGRIGLNIFAVSSDRRKSAYELPEFNPQVLDALRQPLETGETVIARANHRIAYPSRIQLIAAMNPCRCGRAEEPGYVCRQGRSCAERYQARISGPMLDRIDLQIEVPSRPPISFCPRPRREAWR